MGDGDMDKFDFRELIMIFPEPAGREPFFVVDNLKLKWQDLAGKPFVRIMGIAKGESESLSLYIARLSVTCSESS